MTTTRIIWQRAVAASPRQQLINRRTYASPERGFRSSATLTRSRSPGTSYFSFSLTLLMRPDTFPAHARIFPRRIFMRGNFFSSSLTLPTGRREIFISRRDSSLAQGSSCLRRCSKYIFGVERFEWRYATNILSGGRGVVYYFT